MQDGTKFSGQRKIDFLGSIVTQGTALAGLDSGKIEKSSLSSSQNLLREHNEEFKLKQARKNTLQIANARTFAYYCDQDSMYLNYIIPTLPTSQLVPGKDSASLYNK